MSLTSQDIMVAHADITDAEITLDPVNVRLGERIRAMRKLRLMTQSDLAAQLGITFQQVQKYERGKNRLSVSMMLRIARILRIEPEMLLAGNLLDDDAVYSKATNGPLPSHFAEHVNIIELYSGIDDPVWRTRAVDLLKLLGKATKYEA